MRRVMRGMAEILIDLDSEARRVWRRKMLVFWAVMSGVLVVAVMLVLVLVASMPAKPVCPGTKHGDAREWAAVLVSASIEHELSTKTCPWDGEVLVQRRFLRRNDILDPWGRPYAFECERDWQGVRVRVCSQGAEVEDPADDVCAEASS